MWPSVTLVQVHNIFPCSEVREVIFWHLDEDKEKETTFLCPVLGQTYAEISQGECSPDLQQPRGKSLPISFIGLPPYIKYNPVGGSEFLLTQILAKKFGFLPKFVPERAFDVTKENGSLFGMVHRVWFI